MGLIHSCQQGALRALCVFLVFAEHRDGARTVYAGRALLEDGPFVGIPTYCASYFCLIYIMAREVSPSEVINEITASQYDLLFIFE